MFRRIKNDTRYVNDYTRGMLLYRRGQYTQAVGVLDVLSQQEGPLGQTARYYSGMAHREIGMQSLKNGDYSHALHHFQLAVNAIGSKAGLSDYIASIYARNGEFARCSTEMEKSVDIQGQDAVRWRKLAQSQWRAGRKQDAYLALQKGLRKTGDCYELHLQYGLFYAAEERFDLAQESLEQALDCDCSDSQAHYYLGLVYAAKSDALSALRSFQRAFHLAPDNLLLARQLAMTAQIVQQQGQRFVLHMPDQAPLQSESHAMQLAHYMVKEPDFLDALLSLPESEMDRELFGSLADVLDLAIAQHPTYADLLYYSARIHYRIGNINRAGHQVRKAVTVNPKYIKGLMLLAELCAEGDDPIEAIEHLDQAISLGADWPDVHCRAGELLLQCQRPDVARSHLQRALELNPKYQRAQEALASVAA